MADLLLVAMSVSVAPGWLQDGGSEALESMASMAEVDAAAIGECQRPRVVGGTTRNNGPVHGMHIIRVWKPVRRTRGGRQRRHAGQGTLMSRLEPRKHMRLAPTAAFQIWQSAVRCVAMCVGAAVVDPVEPSGSVAFTYEDQPTAPRGGRLVGLCCIFADRPTAPRGDRPARGETKGHRDTWYIQEVPGC